MKNNWHGPLKTESLEGLVFLSHVSFISSICHSSRVLCNLVKIKQQTRQVGMTCWYDSRCKLKPSITTSYLIFINQQSKLMPLYSGSLPLAHPVVCQAPGWEAPAAETGPSLACELVTLSGSGSRTCGGRCPGLGLCGSGSRCIGHPTDGRAAPSTSSLQSYF